jgi:hypothetical protein
MIRKVVTSLIAVLFIFALFTPVFADTGGTTTQVEETKAFCESGKMHPGIAKLSVIFGLDENEVKEYYCMGYGLGAIRQALRAAALDENVNVIDLLEEMEEEFEEEELEEEELEEEELEGKETDDENESVYCEDLETMEHPTGARYAADFEIDYAVIMGWFCEGNFGFGEIKHALKTAAVTEYSPEELLAMRADYGWGEIWQDAGLIGQGKPKVHPVFGENWHNDKGPQGKGKPVDAGPPNGKGKPGK